MKNILFLFMSMLFLASCTIAPSSGEYAVESDAFTGEITVHEGPGMKDAMNLFDHVEFYDKEDMYSFSHDLTEGEARDESIYVKFADFGEANISGTVRYANPNDPDVMKLLHERYDNQEGIEKQLIRQAIERAVYLSGPLMTSQESNGTKRAYLLDIIMDQAQNGIYRVVSSDKEIIDIQTGKKKTIKVSERKGCSDSKDPNCVLNYERSEPSPLNEYGIRLYNFTIKKIKYSGPVEEQIEKQQQMNMQMDELAIEAKKAQTQTITTQENSKAEVAEKEAATAIAVAEARMATAVAEEAKKQAIFEADAEFYKKQQEAKAAALLVNAGLKPEIAAQIEKDMMIGMMEAWAKRPVPSIDNRSIGGGSNSKGLEEIASLKELMLLMKTLEKSN